MSLTTPIFADVATRLRNGPISTSEMASSLEAATTATMQRLPSTRPLDRRWDRSRRIVWSNVKRSTCTNHSWNRDGTITFQPTPASSRGYALRSIAPSVVPKSTASKAVSYVDNPHRTTGFGGSSIKNFEELKAQVEGLQKDVELKRRQISQLRDESKSKADALQKSSRDLAVTQQNLQDTKATLAKETEKLQRSIKQEKESRTLWDASVKQIEKLERESKARSSELLAECKAATEQLQALRVSAADNIAKNAPILEAARVEGEKRAQKVFDQHLQDLQQRHAADLKREAEQGAAAKALQAQIEDLKSRFENQRLQKAGDEAAIRSSFREEMQELRAQLSNAKKELEARILQHQRVAGQKQALQISLEGRQARARDDRVDYHGYRELFHMLVDQVYEALGATNAIRDALSKESDIWRKSLTQFQGSKELVFFRQQSKYNEIKRKIDNFLEQRTEEAQAAAGHIRTYGAELYEARKALDLQGHATRMVTRHLHFDTEPTATRGVSIAHYMALVLPWTVRKEECAKRLLEVQNEIKRLKAQSVAIPADLREELDALLGRDQMLQEHLVHAEAFRRRETFKALLNSSVEDRVTFVRLHEMLDRINNVSGALAKADKEYNSPSASLGSVRSGVMKARRHADELENFVRKRVIVQQELEQLDKKLIKEADAEIQRRISIHKREEELAMDVIVGKRTSFAKTFRERKAEQLRAASKANKASSSLEPLATTPTPDVKSSGGSASSAGAVPSVATRRILTPKDRVKFYQRALIRLTRKASKANGSRHENNSHKHALSKKIDATKAKLSRAQVEHNTMSTSDTPEHQDSRIVDSKQEQVIDAAASSTVSVLRLQPSQPMQASHMPVPRGLTKRRAQVAQWHTLSDALGLETESPGRSFTASSLPSVPTSQSSPTTQTANDMDGEAASADVSEATMAGQSSSRNASPHSELETYASSIQSTSAGLTPSTAAAHVSAMPSHALSDEADAENSPPSSLSSYEPSGDDVANSQSGHEAEWKPEPHTLLDYQIPPKVYRDAVMASPSSNAAYWSHQLYKSMEGKSPIVYYCKNLETAERQCKLFLDEPVLGFDLEWEKGSKPGKDSIKRAVSLIQIAAEDKICLIHVACFAGDKIEQLLPPSLKTILQDGKIAKAGVNISGDASRMRTCFGVDMKGIFELSHMYRLVKTPREVSFKMVNMAEQVQETLLLPLKKDEVRLSAWSKSLNMQQCAYAAADAYAGFRLFHQLDNLRKDMRPTPPRPAFAETFEPIILGDGTAVTRSAYKARSGFKKAAVVVEQDESDEEFLDALEEASDTYGLDDKAVSGKRGSGPKEMKDGEVDIDEVDPDSVLALNDVMTTSTSGSRGTKKKRANHDGKVDIDGGDPGSVDALGDSIARTTLDDLPPSEPAQDIRDLNKETNSTLTAKDTNAVDSLKSRSPHVLVASPETILADMWVSSLPSRNPKVGAASLRVYHLWHHQNYSLDAVAGICRQPPLAMTSVASYIMTAIKEEDMPYEKDRLREVFQHLPKSVWHVYGKWVRELGLDK